MKEIYIAGCGLAKFGKREESLEEIMCEAAEAAIKEANCDSFDAVYVGAMNPEDFNEESDISSVITDHLGLTPIPATRIETASSTGASTFDEAIYAIASGYFKRILVIAGEKMTAVSTPRATEILAEVIEKHERSLGATMPALAAIITRRYIYDYKMTREALSMVAIKNHHNGILNPYAHFQKEITREIVEGSKIVADPLRLYDCSPISDGAAAIVLSNETGYAKVIGLGHGTDYMAFHQRENLLSFRSTVSAAEKAYKMAGITPKDIDFAEVHDAFTPFEIIGTEDLGFFEKGKGWLAVLNGETDIKGALPINPSGGLKARGHPVGASGLAQIVEAAWQLGKRAGKRQLEKAEIGLTQSIGGLATNNLVTILQACLPAGRR